MRIEPDCNYDKVMVATSETSSAWTRYLTNIAVWYYIKWIYSTSQTFEWTVNFYSFSIKCLLWFRDTEARYKDIARNYVVSGSLVHVDSSAVAKIW
jgi:hypothetical protein